MKELDENKIRETWECFTEKHGLIIKEKEIQLFSAANKVQRYLTVEKIDECFIFYKYLFYKFNPRGNYFKVSIPVDTNEKFLICRPGIMSRLFLGNSIRIVPANSIELHKPFREFITEKFKRFIDLRIRTSQYSFHEFGLPQRDVSILEIHTKKIPTEVIELENIRELSLNVFNYFREQNMIKPLTNIE